MHAMYLSEYILKLVQQQSGSGPCLTAAMRVDLALALTLTLTLTTTLNISLTS